MECPESKSISNELHSSNQEVILPNNRWAVFFMKRKGPQYLTAAPSIYNAGKQKRCYRGRSDHTEQCPNFVGTWPITLSTPLPSTSGDPQVRISQEAAWLTEFHKRFRQRCQARQKVGVPTVLSIYLVL